MLNTPFQGELAENPFPQVLALIWREERSGFLRIRRGSAERSFCFEKGGLAVERSVFDEHGFLLSLATLGIVRSDDLAESSAASREKGMDPPSRTIMEGHGEGLQRPCGDQSEASVRRG